MRKFAQLFTQQLLSVLTALVRAIKTEKPIVCTAKVRYPTSISMQSRHWQ